METVADLKDYGMSRARWILARIENATDPFDIEGEIYSLMVTVQSVHDNMHRINQNSRLMGCRICGQMEGHPNQCPNKNWRVV